MEPLKHRTALSSFSLPSMSVLAPGILITMSLNTARIVILSSVVLLLNENDRFYEFSPIGFLGVFAMIGVNLCN